MALGGLVHLADDPGILAAVSPTYGMRFPAEPRHGGLFALGAVFLAVTGAEALYADMGHFGRRPIQVAWLCFVLPSLALNYLGQGALLLAHPEKLENPFFLLYPDWALLPMVVLATIATIIASQAVITGAFSLTQQAIQLGLLPRLDIRRTSETEKGQIYHPARQLASADRGRAPGDRLPIVERLASAYGIAVTGTMVVTSVHSPFSSSGTAGNGRARPRRSSSRRSSLIDLVFLGANLLKIFEGGWMPLAVGAALMIVMLTWRRGTRILAEKAGARTRCSLPNSSACSRRAAASASRARQSS